MLERKIVVGCFFTVLLFVGTFSWSQEIEVNETEATEETQLLQPKPFDDALFEKRDTGDSLMWAIFLFVLMVAVLAGLWIWSKKKGLSIGGVQGTSHLNICETKPLGNRQFLVVVQYGEQKMLLGVAPGMINHLCYLEGDEGSDIEEG